MLIETGLFHIDTGTNIATKYQLSIIISHLLEPPRRLFPQKWTGFCVFSTTLPQWWHLFDARNSSTSSTGQIFDIVIARITFFINAVKDRDLLPCPNCAALNCTNRFFFLRASFKIS